jgi:protein-disulfide isomerase
MLTRRTFTLAPAALIAGVMLMTACSAADSTPAKPVGPAEGAVYLGKMDAPVTIVEYASLTCGHCKQFHEEVLPTIKAKYIATGQVRYEFREFPTPPAQIAVAGAAIARCAGEDKYYDVIDAFFARQNDILNGARQGTAGAVILEVASQFGFTKESVDACFGNQAVIGQIQKSVESGDALGVSSTPTIILNGRMLTGADGRTVESLSGLIDAELAAVGQ